MLAFDGISEVVESASLATLSTVFSRLGALVSAIESDTLSDSVVATDVSDLLVVAAAGESVAMPLT
jgi:hypothetical protein